MGRKDTLAAKSIRKMYEQLNLNQSDIFSKTKLLLGVYRDVVWITLSESARVNEELVYYGECRFVKHLVQREIQRKQQVFLSGRASREGA